MTPEHGKPGGQARRTEQSLPPVVRRRPNERDRILAVLAPRVVREVARILLGRGIEVVPLKGVVLQRLVYDNPSHRRISDVDLLVRERSFFPAVECLRESGYSLVSVGRSLIEVALRSPLGLTVDLHRHLFSAQRYRLSTEDVFRRSGVDTELFEAPVRIASALDTFAHLVGKWASDHARADDGRRLRDLEAWVKHFRLDPIATARHLELVGMGRASRYVLGHVAACSELAFFRAVVESLVPDRVGVACATVASWTIGRGWPLPVVAASAHLLNSTLGAAATSSCAVIVRRGAHPFVQAHLTRSGRATSVGPSSAAARRVSSFRRGRQPSGLDSSR